MDRLESIIAYPHPQDSRLPGITFEGIQTDSGIMPPIPLIRSFPPLKSRKTFPVIQQREFSSKSWTLDSQQISLINKDAPGETGLTQTGSTSINSWSDTGLCL